MAAVQIWFHTGFATGNTGDTALPKEPPVGYNSETVSTSNVEVAIPVSAAIAVIETDAAIAYKVGGVAVFADDPVIAATENSRYVIDVSSRATLGLIAGA